MAATNYTPIQLYYSSTASAAPTAGNLTSGELAINITDGKLYYKDNGGVVQVIATKGAGTIGGSTTQIQYNNAGALAGSASMTFNSGTNVTTLTTLNLTNALGAIYGGTAQSAYAQGDVLYASATNTLSKLSIGTVNYILTSTGSVPQWVAPTSVTVNTATNIAGGAAGSVPYQSGVATTTFLAIGAANRVMTSSGTAPQWVTSLTGLTGVSSSSITNTSLTSGRVVVSTTGGAQADDADLTFDGTTLSAGGFSTTGLSTLVQTVTVGNSNFSGTAVFAPSTPAKLYIGTGTVTDTTSAIGATNTTGAISSLAITPIAATNTSVTYTNAATLYIAGAPSAGTNVTITNPYALYVAAGNSYFGGTVTYAGGINFNGNVTVGDSSADTLTINSTITSNLIFTDNTYDIGASGATRPRNIYTSGTGTFGGTLYTQSSYLGNSKVVLRDNSLEDYATNANAGVAVNYSGYLGGVTQFRDLNIYNGKQSFIAIFQGSTSRFGLNNATPSYLFDMTGQGRVLSTSGSSSATIPSNNLFVIDSNANAGFGLAIPATGNIVGGFYINAGTNTYDGGIDYNGTTRTLNLRSAGTSRIIVDSVGSVGIGVTPNTATFKTLAIGSGSNVGSLVQDVNYNDLGVGSNVYFNTTWKYVKTGEGASLFRLYGYGGTFLWQRAGSGTADANISFSTVMTLDGSGYLGIGNTSPTGRLDVLSASATGNAVYFRGGTYSDIAYSTGIRFLQPAGTTNANRQFRFTSGDNSLTIQGTDGSGTDQSDVVLLIAPSGGNVAIGATSAASRLDVVKAGNSSGGTIMMSGSKTNAAAKYGALTGAHYTSSTYTQGIGLITSVALSTDNNIQIGGGIDELLAATNIRFWTAANTTTATGTQRVIINSAGNVGIGLDSPSSSLGTGLHIATSSGNSLILQKSTGAAMQFRSDETTIRASISGLNALDGLSIAYGASQTQTAVFNANLLLTNGIALGNVSYTDGVGVKFPATQSQSSNANTLDDYEEGTWTPTLTFNGSSTGITYSYQTGTYVKIGRQVTVWATVYLSSKGSATGDAYFTGLPFAPAQTFYNEQHGCVGELNGVTFSGYLESRVGGSTNINIFQQVSGTAFSSLTNTSFTNSASMAFTVTYTTNA